MEEEEDYSTAKRIRTNSLLQDNDDDLDEDEQALARNLPPVSTSRSSAGPVRRSNIVLSDDDERQEGEGKSTCCYVVDAF